MSGLEVFILGVALFAVYLAVQAHQKLRHVEPAAPPASPPPPPAPPQPEAEPDLGPPPLLDASHLKLYALERAMGRSPEVTNPEDLLLVPPFVEMVETLASAAFDNAALEAFVTGDRAVQAWAALYALARRPLDPAIATRAYFWLNNFHTWTRALTLRLLHTWFPTDVELAGRVLVRLDRTWCTNSLHLVALDRFLRQRARVAPLSFEGSRGALGGEPVRERLEALFEECEPVLVADLAFELTAAGEAATDSAATGRSHPQAPPAAARTQLAGRRHEPGAIDEPAILPRAAFTLALAHGRRALAASPRRSVLVSGETGVGKSTLARALAAEMSAGGWRVFETSAIELNAGMSYVGQLEGRVQELLREFDDGTKIVWLVRDFHQLLWAGRTTQNPTGALDMLLPAIEKGDLLVIGETRPAAAEAMLGERPELARLFEHVRLEAPRDEELPAIAAAWVAQLPDDQRAHVAAELPEEAVVLARHHLGALGMPAGLVRLLQRALEAAGDELASGGLTSAHLLGALSELTGLPAGLLDERQSLDPTTLTEFFGRHVMGQPEAVRCLVDRLVLMKAGITSPSRPYAVFLLAGPSGTGKTELVKTLARYLFGSAERMVRVDMSELQNADAFDRLLAAGGIAAGGSLAARVRRQPFSVVLLDEFEKAHASVWDLFLQVFDDGRLTDSHGETVDFRNTFIVLTSNLGARLKSGERLGFVSGQDFNAREVVRAVAATFRPEFLNRLDRIVVFQPLSRDAMREILRKQIDEAFQRRGLRRRDWAVEIEQSALEFLFERGFTADLGARPLQRSLEQHLLGPLARAIVEHRAPEGDQFLFVRADGERLAVEFVDPDAPLGESAAVPAPGGASDVRALAWEAEGVAAEIATLRAATETLERLQAEGDWPARKAGLLADIGRPDFWQRADRFEVLGRAEYLDRVEAGVRSARSLVTRLEGERGARTHYPRPLLVRLAQQLVLLDGAAREALADGPGDAFVAIEPTADAAGLAWRDRLAGMYERWAHARGMRLQPLEEVRVPGGRPATARWLAVSGFAALATLLPEDGLHVLEDGPVGAGAHRTTVRVRIARQPARPARDRDEFAQQAAAAFAAGAAGAAPHTVRRYREEPSPLVRDSVRHWRTGKIERIWAGDFDLVPGGEADGGA